MGVCRDLVKALRIEDAVVFLGAQQHSIVAEEMRQATIFVQHSIEPESGDCEGTPVGILEASASGLPVVSTYHGGIPDVVIDGETGFLVAERDVREMAQRIELLLSDRERARSMGAGARRRIERYFSLGSSINRLRGILESCASGVGDLHEFREHPAHSTATSQPPALENVPAARQRLSTGTSREL
jgi:glycosyltransferase involved in cell wall biosynthesis